MSKLVELTRKPLSDTDILKRLHGKTKVLVYSDFQEYDDLDSLLAPYGNVVFLLKMMPNYGHWMCIKRTGGRISFFDSYVYIGYRVILRTARFHALKSIFRG